MDIAANRIRKSAGQSALTLALLLSLGCAPVASDPGPQAALAPPMAHTAGANGVIVTHILRSGQTISGQPLKLPQGPAEMDAIAIDIPAGVTLPIHQHPWQRFFYVERGTLRVVNHDTGASMDFLAGQVQAEAVGQWHAGTAIGPDPVRVIVIDVAPPGVNNTIMQPKGN